MNSKNLSIVFSDLDGTLLNSQREVSKATMHCLHMLKEKNIIRVIATGRSYYSFKQAVSADFPADYLIFSSGAGVYNLLTDELLYARNHEAEDVVRITEKLMVHQLDFTVHIHVPDNHRFVYYQPNTGNRDFAHRLQIYNAYATPYSGPHTLPDKSAQVIAVMQHDPNRFNTIAGDFPDYKVTRTTSPLDGRSMWMEIYPKNVSKGSAAQWLCEHLGLNPAHSFGIGNDYNDIDLLEFTHFSYVVANAPTHLRNIYRLSTSNNEDGLYHALKNLLGTF